MEYLVSQMNENKNNTLQLKIESISTNNDIDPSHLVLGYLALIKMLDKYHDVSARKICAEIGIISSNILESEFTTIDKRNLLERRSYLAYELKNLENLSKLDEYEKHFIVHGKKFIEDNSITPEAIYRTGIPISTLNAAGIRSNFYD